MRSVAPLVCEANARAKDLVILRELDVGTSLDIIHSILAGLNSDSSLCGCQKSVSPYEERLRHVVGIRMEIWLLDFNPPFIPITCVYPMV
jgi:hypothetical protein